MGTFFGFLEVEAGTAEHHLVAVIDEMLDQVFQVQGIRTTVDQCHVVDIEGALQGGHLEQLVQHHLCVGVTFQFVNDADTFAVRLIADIGDTIQFLFVDQVGGFLDHVRLVDLIRDGGGDDTFVAVVFLDGGLTSDDDASPTRLKGLADAFIAVDDACCGEIRGFDIFHQLRNGDLIIVDISDDTVHAFAEVVRCHVGGHTDSDAVGAVHQQGWDLGGQHGRFLQGVVEVVLEIDSILLQVVQHLLAYSLEAGFGVTHGCGAVAVHGTEVALAIHQRIAQRPGLGHTHHGVIY